MMVQDSTQTLSDAHYQIVLEKQITLWTRCKTHDSMDLQFHNCAEYKLG